MSCFSCVSVCAARCMYFTHWLSNAIHPHNRFCVFEIVKRNHLLKLTSASETIVVHKHTHRHTHRHTLWQGTTEESVIVDFVVAFENAFTRIAQRAHDKLDFEWILIVTVRLCMHSIHNWWCRNWWSADRRAYMWNEWQIDKRHTKIDCKITAKRLTLAAFWI